MEDDDFDVTEIIQRMQAMTNKQRMFIIRNFCVSCGGLDTSCQCWNDE